MRKIIMLEDLDCANCAAKLEDAINNIEGVKAASVNFMTQKLTLETDDDKFDRICKQIKKVARKVDSDITVAV